MSQLVPYSQPNRNVGLLDSFRLAREDRQANAELERVSVLPPWVKSIASPRSGMDVPGRAVGGLHDDAGAS